jgi:hypothetical protein
MLFTWVPVKTCRGEFMFQCDNMMVAAGVARDDSRDGETVFNVDRTRNDLFLFTDFQDDKYYRSDKLVQTTQDDWSAL